ncbi:MAG: hypothetical protein VB082_02970 [Christensenella sp.]|nr:hypothetical protein [Christensenella sp.]
MEDNLESRQSEEMTAQQCADFESAFDEDPYSHAGRQEEAGTDADEETEETFFDTDGEEDAPQFDEWADDDASDEQPGQPGEEAFVETETEAEATQREEEVERALQQKTFERAKQLMKQGYGGEMAWHIAAIENENAKLRDPQNAAAFRERDREEQIHQEAQRFLELYPDAAGDIPDEVYADIACNNVDLVTAYQRSLIDRQQKEIAALRLASKNRRNTPGSVKGRGVEKEDPFIVELMK